MAARTVIRILNGETFAGVDRIQITHCRYLDPKRYRPHIITLFDGLTAQRARELGFEVDVVPMKSRWNIGVVKKIREICRQTNASLIHAHTIRGHLVGALAARPLHIPVIAHIHSPALQESERRLKNLWNSFVEAQLQKRTDRYLVVATSLRQYLTVKGIPDAKIITLLNAINVEGVIEASRGMQPSARQLLNLDPAVKLIGMVAMFRYRKGAQDLLHAVKILGELPVPYRVVMIGAGERLPGGGNYLDVLKQMTKELGIEQRIIYVGYQENSQQWMAELDICVLPSRFGEGLPLVVLEAMVLGVPLIATPVEGTAEVLDDGVTGLLPPPENPMALAEAIKSLLLNPDKGKKMAEEAAKVVRERFDAPAYAKRVMEIYDNILK